jgi:hypothetical protein
MGASKAKSVMNEKPLLCQYPEEWNGYKVLLLPVDDIFQSVDSIEELRGLPFKQTLADDILKNGMRFPILVVHTSYDDLKEAKRIYRKKMRELPSDKFWVKDGNANDIRIWSVWGGSQRLTLAREHGFTHIHCAVIPSIEIARSLQKLMRKPYPALYGK